MHSNKGLILAALSPVLSIGSALGDGTACSLVTYTVTGDYVWSPTPTISPNSSINAAVALVRPTSTFAFEAGFHGLPWPKPLHPQLLSDNQPECPSDTATNSSTQGSVPVDVQRKYDYGRWFFSKPTATPRIRTLVVIRQDSAPFSNDTTGNSNSSLAGSAAPTGSANSSSSDTNSTSTTTLVPGSSGSCMIQDTITPNKSCSCSYTTWTCTKIVPNAGESSYNVPRSNSLANDFQYCMSFCDNEGSCLGASYQLSTGDCVLYSDTVQDGSTVTDPDYMAAELIPYSCASTCNWADF